MPTFFWRPRGVAQGGDRTGRRSTAYSARGSRRFVPDISRFVPTVSAYECRLRLRSPKLALNIALRTKSAGRKKSDCGAEIGAAKNPPGSIVGVCLSAANWRRSVPLARLRGSGHSVELHARAFSAAYAEPKSGTQTECRFLISACSNDSVADSHEVNAV